MASTEVTEEGLLKSAKAKFGRENRMSMCIHFYNGCTYIHLRNSRTSKAITLAIDEYKELFEILMVSLKNVDERFMKEARFWRENRMSVCANLYNGCTYIHLRNPRTNEAISLAIDEYEELFEILMDSLTHVDERFRKEDEAYNMHEEHAMKQLGVDEEEEDDNVFVESQADTQRGKKKKNNHTKKRTQIDDSTDEGRKCIPKKKQMVTKENTWKKV